MRRDAKQWTSSESPLIPRYQPTSLFLLMPSLSVTEFLQYKFPGPFHQAPHDHTGGTVWSDSPPQEIQVGLLLSCTVPQWETVKQLLLDVRQLV